VDDVSVRDLFAGPRTDRLGRKGRRRCGGTHSDTDARRHDVVARYSNAGGAVRVDATLTDSTGRDRAFELSFRLPIAPEGWNWEKNLFESAPIRAGTRYEELDTAFGDQTHSIYPLATIRSDAAELSLAVPMQPQLQRFGCDTREGLRSVWDVGVSPATHPDALECPDLVLGARLRPEMGLSRAPRNATSRSSPRRFSRRSTGRDPGSFAARTRPCGTCPTRSISVGVTTSPRRRSTSTTDNKILSLRYVDVSGYFRSLPGVTAQPEYDVLHRTLDEDAAAGSRKRQRRPAARPRAGRHQLLALRRSGALSGLRKTVLLVREPAPDLSDVSRSGDSGPSFWSVALDYWIERPIAAASKSGGRLDGVFLDDLSDNFASIENYRRPHWAYGDEPLAFSYATGKVVRFNGLAMARFCAALRKRLHELKMVSFGSTSLGATGWFARHLDAMGGEVPGAEPEERVSVRRFFSYGKPWSNLLVPRGKEGLSSDVVAAYLAQALRLGFFPGFSGRYWTDRSSYERDRPLFRRYVPLIREATEAGWRPVPAAVSSAADISWSGSTRKRAASSI
jgi:hypothetical protein